MSEPSLLLRTEAEDQLKLEWRKRGSRYWSLAELGSDTFFVIEAIFATDAHMSSRVFITCNVYDALKISDRYQPNALEAKACFVTPEGQRTIEPIAKALTGPTDDQAVVHLVSGKTLHVRCPPFETGVPAGTPFLKRAA